MRDLFYMKNNAYLNDDKTHVDPRPHNDILWGLKAHCGTYQVDKIPWNFTLSSPSLEWFFTSVISILAMN